jgi:photosystem II stability/assembly factor-like uncharacterized protein
VKFGKKHGETLAMKRTIVISCTVLLYSLSAIVGARAEWLEQHTKTLAWLRAVYFVNENNGWIVGSRGTYLTTNDGGGTWRQAPKVTNDNILDVYFADLDTGWLLCERDGFGGDSRAPSYLLRTVDKGQSWVPIEFRDTHDRIVRLFFNKVGGGFAVGEGGAVWQLLNDHSTWKRVALPVRYLMLGGSFADSFNGAIVGGGGAGLFTTDGGAEWIRAIFTGGLPEKLNSVFFADSKNGWAVGAHGQIYFSDNSGKSWAKQVSQIDEDLRDVHFLNSREGVAVGEGGTIVETEDGGRTWKNLQTRSRSRLERVFLTGKSGFAVGYGGVILRRGSV